MLAVDRMKSSRVPKTEDTLAELYLVPKITNILILSAGLMIESNPTPQKVSFGNITAIIILRLQNKAKLLIANLGELTVIT